MLQLRCWMPQRHLETAGLVAFLAFICWNAFATAAAYIVSDADYSSHACHGHDKGNRTCIYENIYIWKGTMYYLQQEGRKNDPPPVEMIWHIERMYNYARPLPLRSITPSTIPFDMVADAIVDIPLSILWYRMDLINNFSHMVAETSFSIHKLMCEELHLCEYNQPQGQDFHLVFTDPKPPFPVASITEAFKCFSRHEPILMSEIRKDSKVRRLQTTVAGIGPDCRAFHYCMGAVRLSGSRERMKADMLGSWRVRMLKCVGVDPMRRAGLSSEEQGQSNSYNKKLVVLGKEMKLVDNPVQKPAVLIVNRSHVFRRSFLNLDAIIPTLQQGLPQYEVKTAYMENATYATQVALFNSASIVIMVHGGGFGNAPFLPYQGTVVEVMPFGPFCNDFHEFYKDGLVRDIATVTNITLIEFDVYGRNSNHLRMDVLQKDPLYRNLTMTERLALLEESKCPDSGPLWSNYPYRRQQCEVNWLMKAADMVLDAQRLMQVISEIPVPGMMHTRKARA